MDRRCKLTTEQIEEIRILSSQGQSSTKLGVKFGVDHSTILRNLTPEARQKKIEYNRRYMRIKKGLDINAPFWMGKYNKEIRVKDTPKKLLKPKTHNISNQGSYYKELMEKNDKTNLPISILYKHKMTK